MNLHWPKKKKTQGRTVHKQGLMWQCFNFCDIPYVCYNGSEGCVKAFREGAEDGLPTVCKVLGLIPSTQNDKLKLLACRLKSNDSHHGLTSTSNNASSFLF